MLKFHTKTIPISNESFTFLEINNFHQVEVYREINSFFTDTKNYKKLVQIKERKSNSHLYFLKSSDEISVYFTIMNLFRTRGSEYRTHINELIDLTYTSIKTIRKTLLLMEELRIISVSNDVIFEIKYLNE